MARAWSKSGLPVASAVDGIADDRAAKGRAVDADLVGASGARAQFEPSAAVGSAEHAVVGDRPLASRIDDHPPAAAAGEFV